VGRQQKMFFYEKIAYPLVLAAFFSLISTWGDYNRVIYSEGATPLMNQYFLSSLVFLLAIGLVNYLGIKENSADSGIKKEISNLFKYVLPSLFLIALYVTFFKEIDHFWENVARNYSNEESDTVYLSKRIIYHLKFVWIVTYSLGFASALALVNIAKIRIRSLTNTAQVLVILATMLFLTGGLFSLSELREGYLQEEVTAFLQHNAFNLWIRYIISLFFFAALYTLYRYTQVESEGKTRKMVLVIFIHAALVWFASSELLHWLSMAGYPMAYKIWLSILWGAYSVYLIAWGIYLKRKYLRISAIILLGITLIKVAVYDISTLDTLRKTIVFISLGILLLVASFLYNKYKAIIFDSEDS
jgi:uncharacterized membrane protein